jgi:hypothetical protein
MSNSDNLKNYRKKFLLLEVFNLDKVYGANIISAL